MALSFDAVAWGYDAFMRAFGFYRDRQIIDALSLTGEESIVDLGGGTGHYAKVLAPHCREVVVVDESPAMLARVPRIDNITTVQADIRSTGFPDSRFDAALLLDVLHHVSDPMQALAETYRILRPGGRILVLDLTASDVRTRLLGLLERILFPNVAYMDPEALVEALTRLGFTNISLMRQGWWYLIKGAKA